MIQGRLVGGRHSILDSSFSFLKCLILSIIHLQSLQPDLHSQEVPESSGAIVGLSPAGETFASGGGSQAGEAAASTSAAASKSLGLGVLWGIWLHQQW